ncbi:hypothetical protein MJH12_07365 [bacterium]|nr:hypothetical protein [bacterium]
MCVEQSFKNLGFYHDVDSELLYGCATGNHEIVLLNPGASSSYVISFVSILSEATLSKDLWSLLKDDIYTFEEGLEETLDICNQDDYQVRLVVSMDEETENEEYLTLTALIEGHFDIEAFTIFLPTLKKFYEQYCKEIDQRLDAVLFGE